MPLLCSVICHALCRSSHLTLSCCHLSESPAVCVLHCAPCSHLPLRPTRPHRRPLLWPWPGFARWWVGGEGSGLLFSHLGLPTSPPCTWVAVFCLQPWLWHPLSQQPLQGHSSPRSWQQLTLQAQGGETSRQGPSWRLLHPHWPLPCPSGPVLQLSTVPSNALCLPGTLKGAVSISPNTNSNKPPAFMLAEPLEMFQLY